MAAPSLHSADWALDTSTDTQVECSARARDATSPFPVPSKALILIHAGTRQVFQSPLYSANLSCHIPNPEASSRTTVIDVQPAPCTVLTNYSKVVDLGAALDYWLLGHGHVAGGLAARLLKCSRGTKAGRIFLRYVKGQQVTAESGVLVHDSRVHGCNDEVIVKLI